MNGSAYNVFDRIGKLVEVALPSVIIVAAMCLGAISAVRLGEWLSGPHKCEILHVRIEWITSTISMGIIIGLAKDVIQIIIVLFELSKSSVSKLAGEAAKSFFVIGAAFLLFATYKEPTKNLTLFPPLPIYLDREEPVPLAVLPVFFKDNAARDQKGKWCQGVFVSKESTPEITNSLSKLIGSLNARCRSVDARALISLNLVGYASSAEFKGMSKIESQELNKNVSNARAESVQEALGQLFKEINGIQGFEVKLKSFSSYQEMAKYRPYIDRLGENQLKDQEAFDRRVDVQIIKAGLCSTRIELLTAIGQ